MHRRHSSQIAKLRPAARRITQAFELEDTRAAIPKGSRLTDWKSTSAREAFLAPRPLKDTLRERLAMLQGYAAGSQEAVDIAANTVQAKRDQISDFQNALKAASALFGQGIQGADVSKLWVEGTGGNAFLKGELDAATGAPGTKLGFCVGIAWVSGAGSLLAAFKHSVGVLVTNAESHPSLARSYASAYRFPPATQDQASGKF